jgi:hypothetical protein
MWQRRTIGAVVARIVANRLRGIARRWYDSQQHLNVEWRKLKLVLVKQFRKPLPFAKLLLDAATYEATPGQDLIMKLMRLVRRPAPPKIRTRCKRRLTGER